MKEGGKMPYTQDDICIIHLSDLHIMSDNEKHSKVPKVLSKLVSDIAEQAAHMKECIIVISGDIINEAKYTKVNKAAAESFFKSLKEALKGTDVKEILFCPGNHDVERGETEHLKVSKYMCTGEAEPTDNVFSSYNEYFQLTNMIRELWGFAPKDRPFYSTLVKTNELNAAFVVLDLAWNSLADDKESDKKPHPLSIGEFQLSELYKEFKECSVEDPDVVIFVSHYPLIFIEMTEQYSFLNKLLSEEYFTADLFLCGHIHDVDTINYSTHEHSILSLVTGIGWPKAKNNNIRIERRYSLYEINPIRNSCSIIMRKGINTSFDYDYSIYTKAEEQNTKKIVYPLRIPHKNLPYISMKTSTAFDKDYFISSEMSDVIKKVAKCISEIQFDISGVLHSCKNDFLEQVYSDKEQIKHLLHEKGVGDIGKEDDSFITYFEDYLMSNLQGYDDSYVDLITNVLDDYLSQDSLSAFRKNVFNGYLLDICRIYEIHIKELFSENVVIRPHFREYSKDNDCYQCICFYPPTTSRPKDVKWGGLIKEAFINHEPFIYSANADSNKTATEWQEFITLVPIFANYQIEYNSRKNKAKIHKRPKLTFGISVKQCDVEELRNVSRILTIFHYLQVQNDLSNMISYFIGNFGNPL